MEVYSYSDWSFYEIDCYECIIKKNGVKVATITDVYDFL